MELPGTVFTAVLWTLTLPVLFCLIVPLSGALALQLLSTLYFWEGICYKSLSRIAARTKSSLCTNYITVGLSFCCFFLVLFCFSPKCLFKYKILHLVMLSNRILIEVSNILVLIFVYCSVKKICSASIWEYHAAASFEKYAIKLRASM